MRLHHSSSHSPLIKACYLSLSGHKVGGRGDMSNVSLFLVLYLACFFDRRFFFFVSSFCLDLVSWFHAGSAALPRILGPNFWLAATSLRGLSSPGMSWCLCACNSWHFLAMTCKPSCPTRKWMRTRTWSLAGSVERKVNAGAGEVQLPAVSPFWEPLCHDRELSCWAFTLIRVEPPEEW